MQADFCAQLHVTGIFVKDAPLGLIAPLPSLIIAFPPFCEFLSRHELSVDGYFIAIVQSPTVCPHLFNRVVFPDTLIRLVVDISAINTKPL